MKQKAKSLVCFKCSDQANNLFLIQKISFILIIMNLLVTEQGIRERHNKRWVNYKTKKCQTFRKPKPFTMTSIYALQISWSHFKE